MSHEESSIAAEPGTVRRVANFSRAVVRFVANGARKVDDNVYEQRLQTCRACEHCNVERMICQHAHCGCRLRIKAAWKSESCPIGAWPAQSSSEPEQRQPEGN